MTSAHAADAPGGRGPFPPSRLFWALGALVVVVGLLAGTPYPAGIWHDDGVYLMLGRALAEGEGLRYLGVADAPPGAKFPPLYPATLAVLWSVFGEVGSVTSAAVVLNFVALGAAAALFARLLHRRFGMTPGWAAGITALGWLPQALWRSALVPFSEPLFVLLLVLAVSAACRLEERPGEAAALGAFVLATVAAVHVRTVGLAAGLAGAAALLLHGRGRPAGVSLGAIGLGVVPWAVWSARAGRTIPEPVRDVLGPYGPWLWRQLRSDPSAYLGSLVGEARDLLDRLVTLLLPAAPSWEPWFDDLRWAGLAVLLPALLLGLDRLWRRSRTVVLLLAFYLAVVWLWPFRDDRLLAPIAPFLVLLTVEGFRWSGEGAEPPGALEGATPDVQREPVPTRLARTWRGAGVAWALLFAGISIWGLAARWPGAGYEIRTGALARAVRAVETSVPAGGVVGAPELWAGLHLHTGRTVTPSARFLPASDDLPVWGSPAQQHRLWLATGLDHLVLEHGGRVHDAAVEALSARCGEQTIEPLASWREGRLVRIAWSDECRRSLGSGSRPAARRPGSR